MAVIFKPKFSNTAASVPTTANLQDGEFCINTADKIIYQRVGATVIAVANYSTGGGGGTPAGTKVSALAAASVVADANEFAVNEGGTSKKVTAAQIKAFVGAGASLARISGDTGAAGADTTWQVLSADSVSQTSVTPGVVITTTGVGAGTWNFKYTLIFQTVATTTGIRIANNHTGTVTNYIMNSHYVSTGGAAATGVHDAIAAGATTGLNEGFAERVLNTSSKASVGVATANANQMIIVEGILVVSVTGSLEFKLGTEVNNSGVKLMAGSTLELLKMG